MKRSMAFKVSVTLGATLLAVLFLFPLYWTLITSFKTYKEAFASPPVLFKLPDLKNYISYLSQNNILSALINSVIITGSSMLISMTIGTFAAYSLARARIRGGEVMGLFLLASRFIPAVSTVIPTYFIFRSTGLYDTHIGLILINSATNIPYVVWMMRNFFHTVPVAIEESAWIEGCSRMRGFFRVVLPMVKSGITASCVLIIIFSWNEFLNAMMLTGIKAKTMPLTMSMYMGEMGIEWQMMATAGMVIILPSLIFSALSGRKLGAGMSGGAVKG
ncbi:MAG: carbohydrate ABC transporter permease [Oscillospiraceae bacterium]|jgi:ABC-type glycerol-3-phosphate transport system permease component|nr:carbohydrate ABC transporter permease [Oscillospiraceae bacterium]